MNDEIAPDASDSAYWRGRCDDAEAACAELDGRLTAASEAYADAWKLIGRCDMALELVEVARSIRGARARASEMRAEIRQATTPEQAGEQARQSAAIAERIRLRGFEG